MTTISEKYVATVKRISDEREEVRVKTRKAKDDFVKYIISLLSTDYYKKQISDYLSEKGSLVLFFQEDSYQDEVLNLDIETLVDYYGSEGVILGTRRVFLKNAYGCRNFCFLFFCTRSYLEFSFYNGFTDFANNMMPIIQSESEEWCNNLYNNLPRILKLRNYFDARFFPLLDLDVILNKLPYEIRTGEYKTVKYIDYSSKKEQEKILQSLNKDYNPSDVSYENMYLNFMKNVIRYFSDFSNKGLFDFCYGSKSLTTEELLDEYINLMTNYKPIPETILAKFDKSLIKTGDIMHPHAVYGL